jgi:hypothetical protein
MADLSGKSDIVRQPDPQGMAAVASAGAKMRGGNNLDEW